MRILFVTLRALEINSSVTISNLGLLRGLVEYGCEVDLMMPSINAKLAQYDSSQGAYEGINVIRIGDNSVYESLVIGRPNRFKKLYVDILRTIFYKLSLFDNSIGLVKKADAGLLSETKYDLIISTSDPKTSHMFVERLIRKGLKYDNWVQHWGDPLCIDITKKSIFPNAYIRKREKRLFSCADILVYVSPLTMNAQMEVFPKFKDRMHFIPLPYFEKKVYPKTNNKKFTIGYFGDYNSRIRDIMPLYLLCLQNADYKLIIAGSSDLFLQGNENVEILPRVGQAEVEKLEAACDVLVCVCNRSGTQIPGKIYYYSATNRPILIILDGDYKKEIGEYLSAFSRFDLCDNTSASIKDKVLELSESPKEYTACEDFAPAVIARKLFRLIDQNRRGV